MIVIPDAELEALRITAEADMTDTCTIGNRMDNSDGAGGIITQLRQSVDTKCRMIWPKVGQQAPAGADTQQRAELSFAMPWETIIGLGDVIIYNFENYEVTGIKNKYPHAQIIVKVAKI